jgi:peptidoglycan/LPS O-acetylase OafA/YrhL
MGILRLLLAVSVLCAHLHGKAVLGFRLLDGELAVQCFYMISGFYMALVLNQKYRPGQYALFLCQRYLRLWPTYALIVLLTLAGQYLVWHTRGQAPGAFQAWSQHGSILDLPSRLVLVATNLAIVGQDWVIFHAIDPQSGALYWANFWGREPIPALTFLVIGQAWSLGVEISFYLIAPWLVRQRYRLQAGLLLLSLAARCAGYALGLHGDPWNYRFFPFEFAFFVAGSLAYQHYIRFPELMARLAPGMRKYGRWIFYAFVFTYSRLPGHNEQRYYLMVPLLFVLLPVLFNTTRDTAWDRNLGELSYPFYLGHTFFLLLLEPFLRAYFPADTWGIICVLVTLGFSYLVFRYFEAPIEDWRHALLKRKTL